LKVVGFLAVLITGSLLLYAAADLPDWGDPHSRPNSYLSPHYIRHALSDTAVPNIVTAVLADYRSYDTLFETAVVFTAGIAILTILGSLKGNERTGKAIGTIVLEADLIVTTACRLIVPPLQLFGLYVVAHGHHSPGGGFQGGVILGASLILLSLSYDLRTAQQRLTAKAGITLAAIGVLLYAGIGSVCMVLGSNFLDYGGLAKLLPGTDSIMARSHGILGVEIGVAITVMSSIYLIYANLSSRGGMEEGL